MSQSSESFGAESSGVYFLSHMFIPQGYTLVNIEVVSALVPEPIFLFHGNLYISVGKKATERTVPARNLAVYIFFSPIFVSLEYSLINIKVVSALVPERFFFHRNLCISIAKKATERMVPVRFGPHF